MTMMLTATSLSPSFNKVVAFLAVVVVVVGVLPCPAYANDNLASLQCFSSPTTGYPLPFANISGVSMCLPGYYCPNSDLGNTSTYPRYCPASTKCILERHDSKFCDPQGPLEPIPCPAGSYCPSGKERYTCPAEHWCPVGTTIPNSCTERGVLTYCPEGTGTPIDLSGIVLMIVWNIVVVGLYCWARCQRGRFVDLSIDPPTGDSDEELATPTNRTSNNMHHTLLSNTASQHNNTANGGAAGGGSAGTVDPFAHFERDYEPVADRQDDDGTFERPLSPNWNTHGCSPDGHVDPMTSPTSASITPQLSNNPRNSINNNQQLTSYAARTQGESVHSSSNSNNRPSFDSGYIISPMTTPTRSVLGVSVVDVPGIRPSNVPGLNLSMSFGGAGGVFTNSAPPSAAVASFAAATAAVDGDDQGSGDLQSHVAPDVPETARGDSPSSPRGAPRVFPAAETLVLDGNSAIQQQLRSRLREEDIALVAENIARVRGSMMPLHIEFKELAVEVDGKVLLRGVTGTIRPGRVTAIMGPSGAGKTVFLTRLLDKFEHNWKTSGELRVNRQDGNLSDYRHMYGYVPQDDILHPELTVYENVWFSAQSRLPATWSEAEIAKHVNAVIRLTGLEDVQHQIVGEVTDVRRRTTDPNGRASNKNNKSPKTSSATKKKKSTTSKGGLSRKRTSVAMELAAAPSALFLDEPTTGLDAATALDLCILLKAVAERSQLTVGMVIHQPRVEIWYGMDAVLLLAPGGKTVFIGPHSTAQSYFKQFVGLDFSKGNPADLILDGISENAAKCEGAWERFTDYIAAFDDGSIEHYEVVPLPVVSIVPSLLVSTALNTAPEHYGKLTIDEATLQFVELYNETTALASPRRTRQRRRHRPNHPGKSKSKAVSEENPEDLPLGFDGALVAEPPAPNHRGFFSQLISAHYRSILKQSDRVVHIVASVAMAIIATAFLGVSGIGVPTVMPLDSPYTLLSPLTTVYITPMLMMMYFVAISASTSSVAIQSLCDTRQQYWKERSTGRMNPLAYFIGVTTAEIYRLLLTNNHMVLVAYFMWAPPNSYWTFYFTLLLGLFGLDSQATLLGLAVPPTYAPLLCTIANLFISLLNGFPSVPYLVNASFTFYLTEATMIENFRESAGNGIYRNVFKEFHFDHNVNRPIWLDFGVAIGFVIFYRLQAFSMMVTLHKSKQK